MHLFGLHLADWIVFAVYILLLIWIARRTSHSVHGENDFFLAGRKLGGWLQFFLNFGQMTDPSGAARTSSLVYNNGVGAVWMSLQTLFMTPYYWFMNAWFRRARLTTVADLFTDRFGGRSLATIYTIFTVFVNIASIGAGYLISYKMIEVIVVKPAAAYTQSEQQSVDDYHEFTKLHKAYTRGYLDPSLNERHSQLKELRERGAIKSYVSYIKPIPFYVIFSLIVGAYIILGGMAAAAITDAFQGVLIILFSIVLIPFGLIKVGGLGVYHERLPDRMLEMFGSDPGSEFTWYSIIAILLISIIQNHATPGNMGVAGSAKTEEAASIGAISGGFMKRWMIIAWCICGLIAYAIFGQTDELSDPDAVWGVLSRTLLGPGFLGLMLVGILAGDMANMSANSLALSALFVRNIYLVRYPGKSDQDGLLMGRIFIIVTMALGIGIALLLKDIISFMKIGLTFNVAFGAAILCIFKWRRITETAALLGVVISITVIVIIPLIVSLVPGLNTATALQKMTNERKETITVKATRAEVAAGHAAAIGAPMESTLVIAPKAIFFERSVSINPDDPHSARRGDGRFHFEAYLISLLGIDLSGWQPAQLLTLNYVFDSVFPFILFFIISFFTKERTPERAELFYVKMRTPVMENPEQDEANLAHNYAHPAETEKYKLFPGSALELQRWRKKDYIAFAAAVAVALAILGSFFLILQIGRS